MWSCTLAAVATYFARPWRRWSRGSIQRNSYVYIDRELSKRPTLWSCNPSITENSRSKCRTALNTAPAALTQIVSSSGCHREGLRESASDPPVTRNLVRAFLYSGARLVFEIVDQFHFEL